MAVSEFYVMWSVQMNEMVRAERPVFGFMRTAASVAAGLSLAIAALVGLSRPASAVALLNGNSLSVNGLNISIADCQLTLAGVNQASCAAGNLEIESDEGPGASIRIQGIGGGNIFSAAMGSGLYDVSFNLNISAISPGTTVNQVSMGIAGSASGTIAPPFNILPINSLVSAAEVISGTSNNGTINTSLLSTTGSRSFAPVSSFSVNKDLKLNALAGSGNLTLAYVTQSYLPAPEPATIGLVLAGLGGIAVARRRRARLAR